MQPLSAGSRWEQAAPLKLAVGSPSATRDAAGIVCVASGRGFGNGRCFTRVWRGCVVVSSLQQAGSQRRLLEEGTLCCRTTSMGE